MLEPLVRKWARLHWAELWHDWTLARTGQVPSRIVPLESKLDWSKESRSELHRRDVRCLLRDTPILDHDYMNAWADQLGIRHLLDEARQG